MSASPDFSGQRVVVMGLGLNGGGLESARFLASRGAEVTVTDLRDEKILAPSIERLAGLPLRYVLGRHEIEDFRSADFVVKNPAVKPDSPFLAAARRVETDLSLFLASCPARLFAITGSKGKSGTSSSLHWALQSLGRTAFLGGNITVSPLSFIDSLTPDSDVVLELSSWQLGDLHGRTKADGTSLLDFRAAILTTILPDHLDRYGTMEKYVADKRVIYEGQRKDALTVCGYDDWGRSFARETKARVLHYARSLLPEGIDGAWLEAGGQGFARIAGQISRILPERIETLGEHTRVNLIAAGLVLLDLGFKADAIAAALASFPGIEHRLEFFHECGGVRYYNDSAATIPEAAAAAVHAFGKAPVLVSGGTDKALDFSPLAAACADAKAVILLAGTGSAKLQSLLAARGIAFHGPFDQLDEAVKLSVSLAREGDPVVLSPGCASFGMFLNEFDRGKKWKEAVKRLAAP